MSVQSVRERGTAEPRPPVLPNNVVLLENTLPLPLATGRPSRPSLCMNTYPHGNAWGLWGRFGAPKRVFCARLETKRGHGVRVHSTRRTSRLSELGTSDGRNVTNTGRQMRFCGVCTRFSACQRFITCHPKTRLANSHLWDTLSAFHTLRRA